VEWLKVKALISCHSTEKKTKKSFGWAWWFTSVFSATQQLEIGRRVMVGDQPRQKVSDTPSQQKKLGMVVCSCHPSYARGLSRRFMIQAGQQKCETLSQK
jgi:hypothetical protein